MNLPPRGKRVLGKLALVFLGFLFGALFSEAGLRIAGYSYPEFYQLDQSRGYALRPGVEGWYRNEGKSYVIINSDGLRDREHSKAKPPDTFRIAVIGDSYPEALQLPMQEAFWAVLEKRLPECDALPNKKIEVINFGVGGYGTGQELITLREHVWDYSPDLVLLAFTTSNDVTDNSFQLRQRVQAPYFVYRDGKLVLDDSFKDSKGFRLRASRISRIGNWIYDHSRSVQTASEGSRALRILFLSWKSRRNSPELSVSGKAPDRAEILKQSAEVGTDNVVYLPPGNAVWNDAWKVTEELAVSIRNEVKSKGAELLVVTLSNGPQVLPDPRQRQLFAKRLAIDDFFYPDNRIKALCQREAIPVLTLAPQMQAYAEQHKVFLHGFGKDIGNGHWNATGHRVAGEMIAQKICQEGFVK